MKRLFSALSASFKAFYITFKFNMSEGYNPFETQFGVDFEMDDDYQDGEPH